MSASSPLADESRLAALARTGLMDSERERRFDRAVGLASRVLGVPVSLLSLVDAERQFFKAETGLTGDVADARETPLTHSFCQHVVTTGDVLRVNDARKDARVSENLAIRDLDVIGYLGTPVRDADGHVLGSLCAISPEPREWSADDLANLQDIASGVETEIALRAQARAFDAQSEQFRNIIDELPIGVALAQVPSSALVSMNRWGRDVLDEDVVAEKPRDYQGLGAQHADGSRYAAMDYPLVRAAVNGETITAEPMLYRRASGALVELEVSAKRIEGDESMAVATFLDVTERSAARDSAQVAQLHLTRVLEATADPILVLDQEWSITYANGAAHEVFGSGREIVGTNVWKTFPTWVDGPLWHAYQDAMRSGVPGTADLDVPSSNKRYEARAFPGERDLTVYFRDVTAQREMVETRQLLVRELNHRVKNLFAVVSGMIGMTARHSRTPSDMAKALRGRIAALAQAHALIQPAINQEDITQPDVSLQNLVAALIGPHLTHESDSIAIEGPAVILSAAGATALSLILHELATNAAKYGALSVPKGALEVRWNVVDTDLHLSWREREGPTIEGQRGEKGFGSTLIDLAIRNQLGGEMHTEWPPEGIVVDVSVPLARLKA